ncbi:MAG: DUF4430 domain-containing protein [Candidatus Falkowbacteria bacterium]|nr:DUF4430 domain-containing protein [Candidatus Falkowbacteria bacterium]
MKKKLRYIISVTYLLTAFVLIFFVIKDRPDNVVKPNVVNEAAQKSELLENKEVAASVAKEDKPQKVVNNISATIIVDKLKLQISFEPGKSVYDALLMEKNKGKLEMLTKEFSGMGFFVSSIGGLKEADNKHLIYFVNGKSPNVGISSYILKDKDVVEWQLK